MDNNLILLFITISIINQIFILFAIYWIVRLYMKKTPKESNLNTPKIVENPQFNLHQYIENSDRLIEIIDGLVVEEVSQIFWKLSSLGKPYEAINMDTDIEKVSKKIYGLIRNDVIESKQTIYTEDAIMTLIINKTINTFVQMNDRLQ